MEQNNENQKKRFNTEISKTQMKWIIVAGTVIALCFLVPIAYMLINIDKY